jgi:hypothetical protein
MADCQMMHHEPGLELRVVIVAKPGLVKADMPVGD